MNNMQKVGGIASLGMATIYLVGFAVFLVFLNPGVSLDPIERVAFLAEHAIINSIAIILIYVVAGFILVTLVQALHDRLKPNSPIMMQTSAVFGFIWAGIIIVAGMIYIIGMDSVIGLYENDPDQAASVWLVVGIVFQGLGGGIETVGGLWTLMISWAALRSGEFPKILNYLGLVVGIAGIATIVPALEDLTVVFGLGQIPWFIWIGIVLLKTKKN